VLLLVAATRRCRVASVSLPFTVGGETGPPTGTLRESCQSALLVRRGRLRGLAVEKPQGVGQSLP